MTKSKRPDSKSPKNPRTARGRDAVLEDFRKIAGPLRGRNRDQKPKA